MTVLVCAPTPDSRARKLRRLGSMGGTAGGADDFLEDYYDVVVLSTGLGSSILAAYVDRKTTFALEPKISLPIM